MKVRYETIDIGGMSYNFDSYDQMMHCMKGHPVDTWKYVIRDLEMEMILNKLKYRDGQKIDILTEKEIDYFIEKHWLEWTCKFNLSPCGHLTLNGKREYIRDNYETVRLLIRQFSKLFIKEIVN